RNDQRSGFGGELEPGSGRGGYGAPYALDAHGRRMAWNAPQEAYGGTRGSPRYGAGGYGWYGGESPSFEGSADSGYRAGYGRAWSQAHPRGPSPKGFTRSDERIRED